MRLASAALLLAFPMMFACNAQEQFGDHVIPLARPAYGVAVSKYGVIAVADNQANVTFDGFEQHDTVHTGGVPVHVAFSPDGLTAFTVLEYGAALVKMSVYPVRETKRVGYQHVLYNIAVAPSGDAVYFTTQDGWLFKADPQTLLPIDSIALASASNGLAFTTDGDRLYVSTIAAGRLYAVDPTTLAKVDSFDVGGGAQRVAVAPSGDSVYVANEGVGGVNVVRPSTGAVSSVTLPGTPYGLALTADGGRLIVALRTAGAVQVLDRRTLASDGTFPIGGTPRNVAVDPKGGFAVVSSEGDAVKIW